MAAAFWIAALGFHGVVGATALWLGWRWTRRLRKVRPAWLWLLQLLADAMLLSFAALFAAVSAAVFVPSPAFTAMRFLSQAFFGEGVLLAAWVTWLHGRATPRRRAWVPGLVLVAVLALYYEAYHRCPYDLQVHTHSVDLRKGTEAGRVLRVLHLSDLQTDRIGPYERRVLRRAKALQPDLVVFTGDFVQMRLGADPEATREALRTFLREVDLRPPQGFYAVGGDVDGPAWQGLFGGLPIACLDDSAAQVTLPDGERLTLIGFSNPTSHGRPPATVQSVLRAAPRGKLRFALGHSPDFMRALGPGAVDLALAGHTHGGQVVLPFLGPPLTLSRLPRRYAGGLQEYGGLPLHVSRGIGLERGTAPQLRFLCPPEICVLEVRY